MGSLEPEDIPVAAARLAFRMSIRAGRDLTVNDYRRILAACVPLCVTGRPGPGPAILQRKEDDPPWD